MAEAPAAGHLPEALESASSSSGLVGHGEEWILKRYGRLGTPGEQNGQVFEAKEESGIITLSILNTGHFFIYQGQTLLEGFSLLSAKPWLKVGKRSDCLLFGSKAKDESRMFRVQFNGESKEKALENCEHCFQRIHDYLMQQTFPEERIHVAQVAQSMLTRQVNDPGTTYQHPAISVEELGPFLKLCLLDRDFPAFVETVEKELNKLTQK